MKKTKLVGLAALLLTLGAVGCSGEKELEEQPKVCETHTFELVNDGEKHHNKCSVCGFEEEAKDHTFKKDSSKQDVAATCGAAGKAYKICSCGATKEEEVAKLTTHTWVEAADQTGVAEGKVKKECSVCKETKLEDFVCTEHTWVAGATVKNSSQKDCLNFSCSKCSSLKVEFALADATGYDQVSSGKLAKGGTLTWKVVAPKAGTVSFQVYCKYGQSGTSLTNEVKETIWGKSGDGDNKYTVKVGEGDAVDAKVNGKSYQETGLKADESSCFIDFADITVAQGENTISLYSPNQYYRNVFSGNFAIVYK